VSQSYRLKLSRPSLKLRAATRIPAQLVGGDGITITKTAGIYTIAVDFDDLGEAVFQPIDATLTALAALNSTAGLLVQTGADLFTKRTLTGTANEIAVADGDGAAGNPTISIDSGFYSTAHTWSAVQTLTLNQNNLTNWGVNNNSTGANAIASYTFANSVGNGAVGVGGSGYTGQGGFLASRSYLFSSSALDGISIYADGAKPIDFYVNGARVGGFTSGGLTAVTSVSSPLHYGGTASGSTHLVNGTSSGSPSNAYVNIQTNGQFTSIGNATPRTYLDINANLTSSPALVVATSVTRMQGADGSSGGQEWVSYAGASAGNILSGAVANGTSASPTATANGSFMFNLRGYGYTGSAFAVGSIIIMRSDSLWSGTNQGSAIDFYTTPNTTASIALAATLQASGGLSVGTSVDPGVGGILANTSIKSRGATAGVGYATGAGGAITQGTSRTTGVTLDKVAGAITLFSAAGSASFQSFTVTNSAVAATDTIIVNQKSGTDLYEIHVTAVAAGSFRITYRTTGGTTVEQPVFNFAVIKAVTS
jgi:hypothetical protein